MLNDNSLREVAQARFDPGSGAIWTKPQYESYCFSQIPATITRLLTGVGNLVIPPYARETVWWYEPERFVQSSYGHHGGLTPEEMETPLVCYALYAISNQPSAISSLRLVG